MPMKADPTHTRSVRRASGLLETAVEEMGYLRISSACFRPKCKCSMVTAGNDGPFVDKPLQSVVGIYGA
jgi:hypothetical protein